MSQTTKFFIVVGFLWIIYTTLKGHLANYLQLIFAECNASGSNNVGNSSGGAGSNSLTAATNALQNGEKLLGFGNVGGSTYPMYGTTGGN